MRQAIAALAIFLVGCAPAATLTSATTPGVTTVPVAERPADSIHPGIPMPDPILTPGAVFPNATAEQVCTAGYSKSVRDVPESEKREVFRRYNIVTDHPGDYEVDHLISLELGGSNDITNLWPEPYGDANGAREKDKIENRLHAEVCDGTITLGDAQHRIASDWFQESIDEGRP